MKLIGRGRYATETYQEGNNAAGAATEALRNRNVAAPTVLAAPFTPGGTRLIGAILFTPKVSGVLQISTTLPMVNGADADTYAIAIEIAQGTGLTVTGGTSTSDGWQMGTDGVLAVGGVITDTSPVTEDARTVGANASAVLSAFGISTPPLPLNVPVAIAVIISGPGLHAIDQLAFINLAVMELP